MKDGRNQRILNIGIDIGSTTTKTAVLDAQTGEVLFSSYERHHADQVGSVRNIIDRIGEQFLNDEIHVILTGSGAKILAESLHVPFIQEVVANSVILRKTYPQVRTAIELGGQDAKIIFFRQDEVDGELLVADMRMNGSCAGGTGAFIDEMAAVLKTPVEEFNTLALEGDCVYDVSGRCGVYAKTDIQPLLNQGAKKSDLALSALHAIAKQTIGGLAQGLVIEKPVAFEGGPLTFQTRLVDVFAERLGLEEADIIRPEHPETMIARGAALALETIADPEESKIHIPEFLKQLKELCEHRDQEAADCGEIYFTSEEEHQKFVEKHRMRKFQDYRPKKGETVRAYLGIDSGSTTTKFVLMNEEQEVIENFYANNEGDPIRVTVDALIRVRDKYRQAGAKLEILSAGTTGYGEMLFYRAFSTECHTVETVAHAKAAALYIDDATFILDIGGQDMKGIWIDRGIITNIVVNEACSSGCGSFLENFAKTLDVPVKDIAEMAFSSTHPAKLGSRCTVFMNSSIITEQRNGSLPQDILAGLCRSIIENVFTKVIRISNLDSLGDRIVVQGGTFRNDAVLRALEQYTGRTVTRAPYPGIMGAIGAAITAKERYEQEGFEESFIGLEHLEEFSYTQDTNVPCPFCTNHCRRSVVTFSNGKSWITNNRCERGEIVGDPKDAAVRDRLKEKREHKEKTPNLFELRNKLLFEDYEYPTPEVDRELTIGLPRVLSYWETMPFWTTFWKTLGYRVRISDPSSREMYENGLFAVSSDTVCFPAKLVHGHVRNLVQHKVDRIFMPSITVVPSENTEKTSISMCAVVKGYPMVMRNTDHPEKQWGVPFDEPLFHWYTMQDRELQMVAYMEQEFGISAEETKKALAAGDEAQNVFHDKMKAAGKEVLEMVKREGRYAIVLASRPYQNDPLVNHNLPGMITGFDIPVMTADSVPGIEEVDLSQSRIDVVNNYHARMFSSAVIAANHPNLEYIQVMSFGCGHDAYLSDEIQRMMKEISGKIPLSVKLDESDVQGPLRIRVRSFVETVNMKYKKHRKLTPKELEEPFPVKFTKTSKKDKIVLVPNTSHAFSLILSAAMARQGLKAVSLDVGREEAIRLGKQFVHNDICFPAQIVIGEALSALESGKYDSHNVAIGMGKYIGDCRLTHYGALLRKALDDAGYEHVPILTNDDVDYHNMHPGFRMNLFTALGVAFALPMIDVLEELLRKIRPYELEPGSADRAFDESIALVSDGLRTNGISGAKKGFKKAIEIMKEVKYDRTNPRPRVLIVGEYLLNFHPGANHDIERYLEDNGYEIIEARMTDVIRKTYFYQHYQAKQYKVHRPFSTMLMTILSDNVFENAHNMTDKIALSHPLYEKATRLPELAKESDPIIPRTFDAGEGILIPGEILHHAKHGCRDFVILQPFGCLPNHVVGRGIAKRIKELYPDAQVLPLDYDPDVSFANVENRLQMLVMNMKQSQ